MPILKRYGALRDHFDPRDRYFRVHVAAGTPPPVVDLRSLCGPIKNQGDEGSCTANSGASFVEWVNRAYLKRAPVLSAQDLYANELLFDGDFPQDNGSEPRTTCKVLVTKGVCEESLYPYVSGNIVQPTPAQDTNGLEYKLGAYHRLLNSGDVIKCIGDATPWPVLVAFQVAQSFESDEVAKTGIYNPQPNEPIVGGHQTLGVGYDIGATPTIRPAGCPPAVLIQNSWGDDWGIKGFFWMPLPVLDSPSSDLWMVHPGKPW